MSTSTGLSTVEGYLYARSVNPFLSQVQEGTSLL